MVTAQAQLDRCIAKYSPDVAKLDRAAIARMRKRLPAAQVLVYGNYNALAVGFAPNEPDPHKRLSGSGNVVRHVVLTAVEVLDDPQIRELMQLALARSAVSLQAGKRGAIVIKSISARQRPRRPAAKAAKKK